MINLNTTNEVKLINSSFLVLLVLIASAFLIGILPAGKTTQVLISLVIYFLPVLGAGLAGIGVLFSIFKFGRKPWKSAVSHTAQAVLMLLVFLLYLVGVSGAIH